MAEREEFEQPSTLGRGRGRGAHVEVQAASSSTSGKYGSEVVQQGNGNGNGKKRGTGRDIHAPTNICTKPEGSNKSGIAGRQLKLQANYFRLKQRPNFEFTVYRVDFEPEIDMLAVRKRFVFLQKPTLGGHIYDGDHMIYTTQRLPQETYSFECESREGLAYIMRIQNTGTTIKPTDNMANMIFNLILRKAMDGLELQLVGRDLYDQKAKVDLREYKLELWPGYITSIRQHEQDILICAEISHKVMRQETLLKILDGHRQNSRDYQEAFKKEVVGAVVLTAYNNRTYRVDEVDFNSSPKSTFDMKGTPTSYIDYYKTKYNLPIRDPNQPMLVSNPKARDVRGGRTEVLFLVPELCRATGLTDKMRDNTHMMRGMAEHMKLNPEKRKNRLLELVNRLYRTPKSTMHLNEFNTDIDKQLVTFTGRQIDQETMVFLKDNTGKEITAKNDDRVDWTRSLQKSMFTKVHLKRWVVIYPPRSKTQVDEFIDALQNVGCGMQYEVGIPKLSELRNDRLPTYTAEIEKVAQWDPAMIMVIVPNNAADRYAAIKKITCVDRAIPTQVIVNRTLTPKKGGLMSIATKVLIQLNCKLGGAPWMIKFPLKGTMTIGFDVTHDSNNKSNSYGAFVATMDLQEVVQYYSSVTPHKNGEELSSNLSNHLYQALKRYKGVHDALPERIFFYRDGVGEGDIEYVFTKEVEQLKQRLTQIYLGKPPKFSFIIVNKRINTRIFTFNAENPPPGTVVDNTITLPERYDFYLISQSVRQGTVSPTSYNIIHDTSGLSPDRMQQLTYKQCHLYYNWSGTTRVPAVVQYAHKLAFLVGQFLHQAPNTALDSKLYFL